MVNLEPDPHPMELDKLHTDKTKELPVQLEPPTEQVAQLELPTVQVVQVVQLELPTPPHPSNKEDQELVDHLQDLPTPSKPRNIEHD
jgi:hypothetical protein